MKIGLISDTHGSLKAFEKSMELIGDCELILHAGDVLYHGPRNSLPSGYDPGALADRLNEVSLPSLYLAKGNCDAEVDDMVLDFPLLTPYFLTNLDGFNILLLHGHSHSEESLFELGKKYCLDIIVSGHTHIPVIKEKNNVCNVNPGSPSIPKAEDKIPTVGIINTFENFVQILSVEDGSVYYEWKLNS